MKGSPTGGGRPLPVVAFAQNTRDEVRYQGDGDICGTLAAEPGMKQTTYVAFDPAQVTSVANRSNPQPGDPCHTLHRAEPPLLVRMREGKEGGGKGPLVSEDQSLTLATANDQVLAFTDMRGDNRGQGINVTGDIANTMHCAKGPSEQQCVSSGMQVRRLTPVECERLQGFPDGYTNIPWRGKPESPDGSRYKALGNSWAVPVVRYIGERIKAVAP